MSRSTLHQLAIASLAAFGLAGCGGDASVDEPQGEATITPSAVVLDLSTQPLGAGQLQAVSGTYSGCKSRSGSWSLGLQPSAPLPHPALSVVKGDKGCVLALTAVVTGSPAEHAVTPDILLGGSFKEEAAQVTLDDIAGARPSLFVNARLSAAGFDGDFGVIIKYSNEEKLAKGDSRPRFMVATAAVAEVPAPDYTVDTGALRVEADSAGIVRSVSGHVRLVPGATAGQTWVVESQRPTSYEEVDRAYLSGAPRPMPGDGRIAASALRLEGESLAGVAQRVVIIANSWQGVRSYELAVLFFYPQP